MPCGNEIYKELKFLYSPKGRDKVYELFENIELLGFLLVYITVPDNKLEIFSEVSAFTDNMPLHVKNYSEAIADPNRLFCLTNSKKIL